MDVTRYNCWVSAEFIHSTSGDGLHPSTSQITMSPLLLSPTTHPSPPKCNQRSFRSNLTPSPITTMFSSTLRLRSLLLAVRARVTLPLPLTAATGLRVLYTTITPARLRSLDQYVFLRCDFGSRTDWSLAWSWSIPCCLKGKIRCKRCWLSKMRRSTQ